MLSIYLLTVLSSMLGSLISNRPDRLALRQIKRYNAFCDANPTHIAAQWRNEDEARQRENELQHKVKLGWAITASYIVWPLVVGFVLFVGLFDWLYNKNDSMSTDKHLTLDLNKIREETGRVL